MKSTTLHTTTGPVTITLTETGIRMNGKPESILEIFDAFPGYPFPEATDGVELPHGCGHEIAPDLYS